MARQAPPTRAALQPAARKKRRGILGTIGRGFKAVGRGFKKAAIPLAIGGAAFAIPGVGGFLAKGATRFGKLAAKGISRGAIGLGRGGKVTGVGIGKGIRKGVKFLPGLVGGEEEVTGREVPGIAGMVAFPGMFTGAQWHESAANLPPEVAEVIDDLHPNVEAVAHVAQTFGGAVRGPKRNRIEFPGAGEFKLVWHIGEPSASWGWDPVVDTRGAGVGFQEAQTFGGSEEDVDALDETTGDEIDQIAAYVYTNYLTAAGRPPSEDELTVWIDALIAGAATTEDFQANLQNAFGQRGAA